VVALPVADSRGHIVGIVSLTDLAPLVNWHPAPACLVQPVERWMRPPGTLLRSTLAMRQIRQVLAECGESSLPVVDESGHYLGIVTVADLLSPLPVRPRPPMVGGMATPWGVYLTTGAIQAGAGNLALAASGLALGAALAAAHGIVGVGAWLVERSLGWPLLQTWIAAEPAVDAAGLAGWLLVQGAALPLFLLMMRLMPLAGYHAAEHQVVHAMERGEPLEPEIVARMPRVHPRCGTNLMAGGLMFAAVSQGVPAVRFLGLDAADGAVLGAAAALFTWRSVGAFLQQHFTTRTAAPRHIVSTIAAARDLEERWLHSPPARPSLRRRIWCSGAIQTLAGVSLGIAACHALVQRMMALLP